MRRELIALLAGVLACDSTAPAIATHVEDWRDEVIYELVVDRFENGDPRNDTQGDVGPVPGDLARYQGGDWAGVTQRLDYLSNLGVTVLWISPAVRNVERTDYQDGYHGYWAADFTSVNPHFGSLDELRTLVDGAHARSMKVILDVVTNHTGRVFFYDFNENGEPEPGELEPPFSGPTPYAAPVEWLVDPPAVFRGSPASPDDEPETVLLAPEHFHRRGRTTGTSQLEKEFGDFPTGLRDLDTEQAEVSELLVDTYVRWVEMTDVDGFRLDAVPHVPHAAWASFAQALRIRLSERGKHQFFLLGEVFHSDPARLASYTDLGALDAVFDFTLKRDVIDGFILDGQPAATARVALDTASRHYPATAHPGGIGVSPWQARVAFADNHDVPRLRYWLNDRWAAELAMTVVYTAGAIPCVYYGTEQELDGGWGNDSREVLWQTGFDENTSMFRHLARLARVRAEYPALRRGSVTVRYASEISARNTGPGAGLLAWERALDGEIALVALNGHPIDRAVASVPTGFAPGTVVTDALSGSTWTVDDAGSVAVDLSPRTAVILTAP